MASTLFWACMVAVSVALWIDERERRRARERAVWDAERRLFLLREQDDAFAELDRLWCSSEGIDWVAARGQKNEPEGDAR